MIISDSLDSLHNVQRQRGRLAKQWVEPIQGLLNTNASKLVLLRLIPCPRLTKYPNVLLLPFFLLFLLLFSSFSFPFSCSFPSPSPFPPPPLYRLRQSRERALQSLPDPSLTVQQHAEVGSHRRERAWGAALRPPRARLRCGPGFFLAEFAMVCQIWPKCGNIWPVFGSTGTDLWK